MLPGTDINGDRLRLANSHQKPLEGEENLGEAFADPGEGGGRCADIWVVLLGNHAGNTALKLGYVGGDPPNREVPRLVPPPGCEADTGEAPTETSQWDMAVPPNGGSDARRGLG